MAKTGPGVLKVSGNLLDLNFVQRKDGNYVRRPRGTVKAAPINNVLRSNVDRHKLVTRTAMAVNNTMKLYCGHFRDGGFWTRLLSRLKKCPTDELAVHLASLHGLDLHRGHLFGSILPPPSYLVTPGKDNLTATLTCQGYPDFGKNKADCYRLELIMMVWNKKTGDPVHKCLFTEWNYFDNKKPFYQLVFDKTPKNAHYLLALKMEAGIHGKPADMMWGKGVVILGSGKL